jgi:hypothetical protein
LLSLFCFGFFVAVCLLGIVLFIYSFILSSIILSSIIWSISLC